MFELRRVWPVLHSRHVLVGRGTGGSCDSIVPCHHFPQFSNALAVKSLFLPLLIKPGFVAISLRHEFLPENFLAVGLDE